MKKIIVLLLIMGVVSCKENKVSKSLGESKEGVKGLTEKVVEELPKPESKLKGQFKFGLSQADKMKWKKTSRAYKVRSRIAESIKLNLTFYGNGNGVYFHDNGKYEYMTKQMIDDASFEYKIKEDSILIKENAESKFKLFGIIKDGSINKDYFDVDLINKRDFEITFGMYKVGKSPK